MMHILVIRFSSLGDVALTIPVFKTLAKYVPQTKFYFLTRPVFKDLFQSVENVEVIPVDIDEEYDGALGLKQLAHFLKSYNFDKVVDLHDVLRTKVLRNLLKLQGKEIVVFDKGRKEKKAIISKKSDLKQLPHATERYLKAFDFISKDMKLINGPWLLPSADISNLNLVDKKDNKWIGLAPFSKHKSKEWKSENWLLLIESFSNQNFKLFVFAFGKLELQIANNWKEQFPSLQIIDNSVPINHQLSLIKTLDVVVSSDSANMHLAALVGTKVVSLWFSTHPCIGFGPLENEIGIIQPSVEDAPSRPLSIYGKIKNKKDELLVSKIKKFVTVDMVIEKINQLLS